LDRDLCAPRWAVSDFRRLVLGFILALSACAGGGENRFPTSADYPVGTMSRVTLKAGVPEAWNLSALTTNHPSAPWKLVIITGTPSLSEYWAPLLAGAPKGLEVIVADRPGFKGSGPDAAVTDIATQARALSVLLEPTSPGQKVILAGQSYGGPISTLMAANNPEKVQGLILVSAFFGERGPTIKRLSFAGGMTRGIIGRDLRNGLDELRGQAPQLPAVMASLDTLKLPVVVLHGAKDTFVTMDAAQRLATRIGAPLVQVPSGDPFLNACCVSDILSAVAAVQTRVEVTQNQP
jgi:pimeloyl-ACP methyl ester carboxylesterase